MITNYMVWPNKGTQALKTIVARAAFHKLTLLIKQSLIGGQKWSYMI